MSDLFVVLGCLLVVAGIAVIYWPVAIVVSGLLFIGLGYVFEIRAMKKAKP